MSDATRKLVRYWRSADPATEKAIEELYSMVRTLAEQVGYTGTGGVGREEEEKTPTLSTGQKEVYVFRRAFTIPGKPIGTEHEGWEEDPPEATADGQPLWMSHATFALSTDALIEDEEWSTPVQIEGNQQLTVTIIPEDGVVWQNLGTTAKTFSASVYFGAILLSSGITYAWTYPPDEEAATAAIDVSGEGWTDTAQITCEVTWNSKTASDQITVMKVNDGNRKDIRFQRAIASPPWNEDEDNPDVPESNSFWEDAPPTGADPLWMIWVLFGADGHLADGEEWSQPVRLDGDSIQVQYSTDGVSWHSPPFVEGDLYMQQMVNGAWSPAMRIVGEQGTPFTPDEVGTLANRPADPDSDGYSYYATDEGMLYFWDDIASEWSDGLPFGQGEAGAPGASVWYSFNSNDHDDQPDPPGFDGNYYSWGSDDAANTDDGLCTLYYLIENR